MIFGDKSIQFVRAGDEHGFIFYPDVIESSVSAWTAQDPDTDQVICEMQALDCSEHCRHVLFHNYVPSGRFQDKNPKDGQASYRIPCYYKDGSEGPDCKAYPLEWLKYPHVWLDLKTNRIHLLAWVNLGLCSEQSYHTIAIEGEETPATDYKKATSDTIIRDIQGTQAYGDCAEDCYHFGRHKLANVTRAIIHCEGTIRPLKGRINDQDPEYMVLFEAPGPYIVATFNDQVLPGGAGIVSDVFPEFRIDDGMHNIETKHLHQDSNYFNISTRIGSPCGLVVGDLDDLFSLKQFITPPYRLAIKMLDPPDPRGGIIVGDTNANPGNHGLLRDVFCIGKAGTMLHVQTRAHFNYDGSPGNKDTVYGPLNFTNQTRAWPTLGDVTVAPGGNVQLVKGWIEWYTPIYERASEPVINWQRNDQCKERGGPSRRVNDQGSQTPVRRLGPSVVWAPVIPIPLILFTATPDFTQPIDENAGSGDSTNSGPGGWTTSPG